MPTQYVIGNKITITDADEIKSRDNLRLAGEMLAAAAQDFKDEKTDIGYIKCILLAEAAKNIAYLLINEFSRKSKSEEKAALINRRHR